MASSSPERPTKLDTPGLVDVERDEAAASLLGTTLQDTYILHRLLGEGGMGLVFEAHHTRIAGKRYAIKVLRAEMASSAEVRTRFQREADAAASIDHPNVVGVHDFGYTADGRPYIVNQYLEGLELGDFIEQQRQLSPELAVYIARQVCHALEAAHEAGVIHRDSQAREHLPGRPPGSPQGEGPGLRAVAFHGGDGEHGHPHRIGDGYARLHVAGAGEGGTR